MTLSKFQNLGAGMLWTSSSDFMSPLWDVLLHESDEYVTFELNGETHYAEADVEIFGDEDKKSTRQIENGEELVLVHVEGPGAAYQLVAADMFGEDELKCGDTIDWEGSGLFGWGEGEWNVLTEQEVVAAAYLDAEQRFYGESVSYFVGTLLASIPLGKYIKYTLLPNNYLLGASIYTGICMAVMITLCQDVWEDAIAETNQLSYNSEEWYKLHSDFFSDVSPAPQDGRAVIDIRPGASSLTLPSSHL